jgi:hypothetical protein
MALGGRAARTRAQLLVRNDQAGRPPARDAGVGRLPERQLAERLAAAFAAKYGGTKWEYRPPPEQWDRGGLWLLRPGVAFGWGDFPRDVTRWRFEQS